MTDPKAQGECGASQQKGSGSGAAAASELEGGSDCDDDSQVGEPAAAEKIKLAPHFKSDTDILKGATQLRPPRTSTGPSRHAGQGQLVPALAPPQRRSDGAGVPGQSPIWLRKTRTSGGTQQDLTQAQRSAKTGLNAGVDEGVADDQGVLEAAMRKEAKEKEEHLQSELKSFRDYIVMFVLFANLLLGLVVVVFDSTGEATMWSLFYAGTFSLSVRILFSFIYLLEKPYKGACNTLIYAIEWLARLTCRCCCCLPRTWRAWMRSTCVLPDCCQGWCSWSLLCPWRGNRRKVLLDARRQLSRNNSEEFAFELNQDNNWEARSAVK